MKKKSLVLSLVLGVMLMAGVSYGDDLRIDGSTTVLPIAQRAAEVFMKKHPDMRVFVTGSGSGTGIKALIDGTTNIATSSREAKDKEISDAKAKGVALTPHKIALDGIVPVVHPSMKITDITMDQHQELERTGGI